MNMNTSTSTKIESGSSQVLAYLRTLPFEQEFSRVSIYLALKEKVSEGAIGGFLARLKKEGAIKLSHTQRQTSGRLLEHYVVEDLSGISTKKTPTRGGVTGRTSKGGPTNRQKLIDMLMLVAGEIENMQTGLADYTTQELLKEITKRTNALEAPRD